MGTSSSLIIPPNLLIGYDKVLKIDSDYILISTLSINEQNCLISNTIPCDKESEIINNMIGINTPKKKIIIYGKNCCDLSMFKKSQQLALLGFVPYIYMGGMFEWLCLQDIYGADNFQTTSTEIDILKYAPCSTI